MATMLRRSRFADVISRQLDLFEREEADLIRQCVEAERAYDRADRGEAEERYGDYVDLVETGTEALADLRWTYAATLDEDAAEEYEEAFNRTVKKRLPRFGNEIDLR
jgi:predicted translin family RNA/ssDNA-binding protein